MPRRNSVSVDRSSSDAPKRARRLFGRKVRQSHIADAAIMPLVNKALDQYDRHTNDEILWHCPALPQSPATIDWLTVKLERPVDADDYQQDVFVSQQHQL